jgi:signal transduction histidine kinase/ligand-binding sensor domain-containing protein
MPSAARVVARVRWTFAGSGGWGILLLALLPAPALALDLGQQPFTVRTWDRTYGINGLSQGREGLMWVASRSGLARFDGERFVEADLGLAGGGPAFVRRVLAAADGSVWVALGDGSLELDAAAGGRPVVMHGSAEVGLLRLAADRPASERDRWRSLGSPDGLRNAWVWALLDDGGGGIWAGTEGGLGHFTGGRFQWLSAADGLPASFVTALASDRHGGLVVGTTAGVALYRGGKVVLTPIGAAVRAVAADRAGRLWAVAAERLLRLDLDGTVKSFPAEQDTTVAVDHDDNVWVSGPTRVFSGGEPAPLTTPVDRHCDVTCFEVDRDGSVWFGVREGDLRQISLPAVRNIGPEEGLLGKFAFSILKAHDGSMFIASSGGFSRLSGQAWTRWRSSPQLGVGPRDLAEGQPGSTNAGIWLASEDLLLHAPWLDGALGTFRTVRRAPPWPGALRSNGFRTVVASRNGDLWVSQWPTGLLRFAGGDPTGSPAVLTPEDGLCSSELTHGIEASDGSLWFATYYGAQGGGATRVEQGKAHCYGRADGIPSVQIGIITQDREGTLWLGTGWGAGLVRFRDGKFATVPASAGLPGVSITGLLDDGRGQLWIGSEAGVYLVSKRELHACADGPCPGLHPTIFGKEEGMRTAECTGAFHPNMTLDDHGNVWVATLRGVSVFRPLDNAPPLFPPGIESISVDGAPAIWSDTIRLGSRQRELVVRYSAPSFLPGRRPSLRHRLRGVDGDWIRAGSPAVAHYHNLAAGDHVLELSADESGTAITRLSVMVDPPFLRSRSFLALLLAATAALVLLVHRLRLAGVQRAHQAISEERARIARDLHDGLAQKLTAIRFLTNQATASASQSELLQASQIAVEAGAELRRAIWDMRETESRPQLEALIERVVSEVVVPEGITVKLMTSGTSRRVPGMVAHETPLVVKEALLNAVRHARATTIEVGVLSDEDGLHVWVRDDGCGFAAGQTPAGPGYGLIAMHERARRIGGQLIARSEPDGGTCVSLYVPGRAPEAETS